MSMPLVSIICITYNHAFNIGKCINGFLMQKTDFPFEILIHDDASTDNTADIIREYEQKYPNIIKPIYQKKNQFSAGISIINTYIIPKVKGKYITWCEGDDYWTDESFLQDGISFLENNSLYNCYVTDSIHKGTDFEISGIDAQKKELTQVGHDISFDNYVYFHTSARIYRNIPDKINIFKRPYIGEIFWLFVFLDIGKVYFDHKITSVYNITGTGIYSKLSIKEKEEDVFKVCVLSTKLLNNKYYCFFWNILPKQKYHYKLKKIFGIKYTMCLLKLLNYNKYKRK